MTMWGQISFQNASSPIMTQLILFHDHAMAILVFILTFVSSAMLALTMNSLSTRTITEAQEIETIWTIVPAIVLLFLTLPSLRLLYLMDEVPHPHLTVKSIGHQWYWSYEYSDFKGLMFNSYITPQSDLKQGQFRLLEVDNRMIIPINTTTRLLVTAADVIHSWTIPSLGIKVDAVPGRLNQASMNISYPGIFYGQCSEICGANHSFMPITMESVPSTVFSSWVKHMISNNYPLQIMDSALYKAIYNFWAASDYHLVVAFLRISIMLLSTHPLITDQIPPFLNKFLELIMTFPMG